MKKAEYTDKDLIVTILTKSFETNQSVNYIVKQDAKRVKRIKSLMDYSFEVCSMFGEVLLSEDRRACALVLYPDRKRTTLKSIWLDLKLIFNCIGLSNVFKAMDRESKIKKIQPKEQMCYLWFIGVNPLYQNFGIGGRLLSEIIKESEAENRPVYLETSTKGNIPWYKKFGFEVYDKLELDYTLYFLKRTLNK